MLRLNISLYTSTGFNMKNFLGDVDLTFLNWSHLLTRHSGCIVSNLNTRSAAYLEVKVTRKSLFAPPYTLLSPQNLTEILNRGWHIKFFGSATDLLLKVVCITD